MQRPWVTRVQQPCERLAVGIVSLHGCLKQGLLDVAGHVTPYGEGGIAEQKGKSLFIIRHRGSPSCAILAMDRSLTAVQPTGPDEGTNNYC
jgi:hypothetical protein